MLVINAAIFVHEGYQPHVTGAYAYLELISVDFDENNVRKLVIFRQLLLTRKYRQFVDSNDVIVTSH